ncbi:MAG: outer membrane beta-barrel protein [Desulfovibrio sp.]|nr:outer membrane beta-barrel protein [Desulfovibrio sp.]
MKRILVIAALVLSLALPGLAAAEGTGMYIAPKFLMSIQDTGTVSRSSALAGSGIDDYSQFTLGGALAVGYDFWTQQMIPLRFEVEFALRGNSEKSWSDNGVRVDKIKGTWNNSTLFANLFWDFHNDTAFTPYIGAGLGLAFNYTGYDVTAKNGDKYSVDDRFTNFAWNAGAGVSYSFNDNFAVDASYRFVGLGYNEVSTTYNGQKYEIGNDPYNNEFMLGLRFAF